jgi:hypothetical protein
MAENQENESEKLEHGNRPINVQPTPGRIVMARISPQLGVWPAMVTRVKGNAGCIYAYVFHPYDWLFGSTLELEPVSEKGTERGWFWPVRA